MMVVSTAAPALGATFLASIVEVVEAFTCRGLLILTGEIVLADGAADVREGGERLARGVQHLARPPQGCPGKLKHS